MYLYLKSSKPEQKYVPEKVVEMIELDWSMCFEDYVWFLLAGIVVGGWSVMLYLVFHQ